jgi:hypothetical protein
MTLYRPFTGKRVYVPVIVYSYLELTDVNRAYDDLVRARATNSLSNFQVGEYVRHLAKTPWDASTQQKSTAFKLDSLRRSEALNDKVEETATETIEEMEQAIARMNERKERQPGQAWAVDKAIDTTAGGLQRFLEAYHLFNAQRALNQRNQQYLTRYAPTP